MLFFSEIILIFQNRDDGGLRVFSDDVPGFVLSHHNWAAVLSDIKPALEVILSEMWGIDVIVFPMWLEI